MQRQDFSHQFDILLNSFNTAESFPENPPQSDIRLNEYEKSIFLTKAQESYVESLYTGKNPYGESFEQTEELRRYLAPLVLEANLTPISTSNGLPLGVDSKSKFFTLPENTWFITYESVKISDGNCDNMTTQDVFPVRQDEYHKLKKNPFRGANNRRALRLDLSGGVVEIVSKFTVTQYYIRYMRKLKPIVLTNLGNDASIEGYSTPQDCEVHEALHQKILEMAVRMALQSKANIVNENKY